MIEALPKVFPANRVHDSDDLDDDLRGKRIKFVASHRKTGRNRQHKIREKFAVIKAAGSSNGFLPGSDRYVNYSIAEKGILRTLGV